MNRERVRQRLRRALSRIGLRVERPRAASTWLRGDRVSYQKRFVSFDVSPGQQVLDVGSGGSPFPQATVLVDRFPAETEHRSVPLVRDGRHLVVAELDCLPFTDRYFDYVYCSHVLEHVRDPIAACREIMRVGRRGYIETPTLAKDMLFTWARGKHRWHVVAINQTLCFFEYSERQLDGIRSTAWTDVIFSSQWNPLQDAFEHNQDLFNVMLTWSEQFSVVVFSRDGRMSTLN